MTTITTLAMSEAAQKAIFVCGFLIVVALLVYAQHLAERKRTARIRAWARSHGFDFCAKRAPHFHKSRTHFGIFNKGHSRRVTNTAEWTEVVGGRPFRFTTADYQYTTGSGKNSTTWRLSFLLVATPFSNMPRTGLRREGPADAIAAAFGFDDIDFEDAEFSKQAHVSSQDKRFAYDLFDPRMIEHLKTLDPLPTLEFARDEVLLYRTEPSTMMTEPRWEPEGFDRATEIARGMIERFPEHLVRELAGTESA